MEGLITSPEGEFGRRMSGKNDLQDMFKEGGILGGVMSMSILKS